MPAVSCWLQIDELKQHIKMLQAVGYNVMEGEDVSPRRNVGTGAEGTSTHSLETLLLAKNRHLEHELTMAKLQVADLTGINWHQQSHLNAGPALPCYIESELSVQIW